MDVNITLTNHSFLHLLQLSNSNLPVGAYSYSEGLETLIDDGVINTSESLEKWLVAELNYGAISMETGVMLRSYNCTIKDELDTITYWNRWLSATRETEEMRISSHQMGGSLLRLLEKMQPQILSVTQNISKPCNYAIAFGIAAARWEIHTQAATIAYLHSWVNNLILAGIKLIPLGQTTGQQLLLSLQPSIIKTASKILNLNDDELECCNWGVSLASMRHEIQYTRLFRS
ncbi:MAG: urease accessory protein UreF [Cyanobacteria bacterium P01_A01_bin.45]